MNFDYKPLATRIKKRLVPFLDLSAWILVIVALIPLFFIDRAMALTLVQWTLYGLALAGVAVVISRVVLPQIDLSEWVELARKTDGPPGAHWIVFDVMMFLAITFLGLVLWAKA